MPMRNRNGNICEVFNSIPDIFVIIFVIKTVSSMDAENPLVDVDAFPTTAPMDVTAEHEHK